MKITAIYIQNYQFTNLVELVLWIFQTIPIEENS